MSGIGRRDEVLWYRRLVEIPDGWRGDRVLLHFGAVDQKAQVWVNNQLVATHEGGYTAFSADITDVLRPTGPQELTVRAEDRTDIEPFPVGKQRNAPGGICYTASSGIWQTVWLEPVPTARVERLELTPDLTGVTVFPQVTGGSTVVVVLSTTDGEVARGSGEAGTSVRVDVPEPHLWTPDDPHLYTLEVRLLDRHGAVLDEVGGYAGLRTIGLVPDAERPSADRAQRPDHLPPRPARPGLLARRHLDRADRRRVALRPRKDEGAGLQLRPQTRQGRSRPAGTSGPTR